MAKGKSGGNNAIGSVTVRKQRQDGAGQLGSATGSKRNSPFVNDGSGGGVANPIPKKTRVIGQGEV